MSKKKDGRVPVKPPKTSPTVRKHTGGRSPVPPPKSQGNKQK